MGNDNDIDDLFKDIVEPNEMNHSDKVWESLNYHLEKKGNERNKAIIFRLRIAVGVLLFLFSSLTLYYFFNSGANNKSLLASERSAKTNSLPFEKKALNMIKNKVPNSASPQIKPISVQDKTSTTKGEKSTDLVNKKSLVVYELDKSGPERKQSSIENSISKSAITSNLQNKLNGGEPLEMNSKNVTEQAIIFSSPLDSNTIATNNIETLQLTYTNTVVPILSQEKTDSLQKTKLKHRFSVVAYFSPDLTMKYLKDNNNNDNQSEGDYNNQETRDFSYNCSLLIGYDLTKHWAVKFGGTYAYLSQTIKPKTVYATTGTDGLAHYQFNTTYGSSELPRDQTPSPIVGDSLNINSNSIQSLQIISIPLMAKYQITRKKFNYYVQFGVSLNFLAGEKLIVETPNKPLRIDKIEGLNEYYFGGILGLGVSYNPIKRLSIIFEPTMRGAITPINNNTPISTHPISFGLALGLGWHF